jgi:hypothetical protein
MTGDELGSSIGSYFNFDSVLWMSRPWPAQEKLTWERFQGPQIVNSLRGDPDPRCDFNFHIIR